MRAPLSRANSRGPILRATAHRPSTATLNVPSCSQRASVCHGAKAISPTLMPKRRIQEGAISLADASTARMQYANWYDRRGVVLAPPSRRPGLPKVCEGRAIVLVEGTNDATATLKAVNAPILIAGGTNSAKGSSGFARLQRVAGAVPSLVVLADPDPEGTRFRNWITQHLGGNHDILHAFIPVSRAVLSASTEHHYLGNVGVEHAQPRDIARAIELAQPRMLSRSEFSRQNLEDWGLTSDWHDASKQHLGLRRELVGNALGLGKMDGAKLVKTLNNYGFSQTQFMHAVRLMEQRLPKVMRVLEAVKSVGVKEGQLEVVNLLTRPSIDSFVYAIQKKASVAITRRETTPKEAPEYIVSYLRSMGWQCTPQLREALSELFSL